MKKGILMTAAIFLVAVVLGQEKKEEKKWSYVANTSINISQTSFSNWALGGQGSVGGVAILNLGANYVNGKYSWENSFVGQYGLQKIEDDITKKSIDMFDINSKYGYKISDKWGVAALLGIKSQFTKGYTYDKDLKTKISNLFAPGYVITAVGFDYKPNTWSSVLLSPVTGKHTLVLDDDLSNIPGGSFGVDEGDKYRVELGAMVNAKMQKDIMKNINLISALTLFTPYSDSFGNVDITWDLTLAMKVNKYISATISTSLLYDDNVVKKVQFKEVIGVGFAYNFME